MTVQWQVSTDSGTTWSNDTTDGGATTTTLTVTNSSGNDLGNEYRAVYTNAAGSTATAAATFTSGPAPVLQQTPAGVFAMIRADGDVHGHPELVLSGAIDPVAGVDRLERLPVHRCPRRDVWHVDHPRRNRRRRANAYRAVLTSGSTSTTTYPAGLYVIDPPNPGNQTVVLGGTATFSVVTGFATPRPGPPSGRYRPTGGVRGPTTSPTPVRPATP